jgi:hypothetical protein
MDLDKKKARLVDASQQLRLGIAGNLKRRSYVVSEWENDEAEQIRPTAGCAQAYSRQ